MRVDHDFSCPMRSTAFDGPLPSPPPSSRPRRVVIESPFSGGSHTAPCDLARERAKRKGNPGLCFTSCGAEDRRQRNLRYLDACVRDSLRRGEAPFASHGFYPRVLDDWDPEQRRLGTEAGFVWGEVAELAAVYADLGLSRGMKEGLGRWGKLSIPIETRFLGEGWDK